MLNSIFDDIKRVFSYGNMVNRLIVINVGIFVFLNLIRVLLYFGNGGETPELYHIIFKQFVVSSDWWQIVIRPWTIITSIFTQVGVWHLAWNMILLYWFGRIVGDFLNDRRILPLYFLGGLAGVLVFFVSFNLIGYSNASVGTLHGSSAAVLAMITAAAVTSPDYNMRLLLLGNIPLKYIAIVIVFLDFIATAGSTNVGGHFAHLGGAGMGALFVILLRNGTDLSEPFNRFFDWVATFFNQFSIGSNSERRQSPLKMVHSRKAQAKSDDQINQTGDHQQRLDIILDKINKEGYENLTEEEKDFLYQASKK